MNNIWDDLAHNAHRLLIGTRRTDRTPAVTLIRSLHPQRPHTPAAICSHLDTVDTVLPSLARYAAAGDPHALLMAAVLMRHPLRRIAETADPDGYHTSDLDCRANDTLTTFFNLIRTCAEPHILTTRYLYGQTLKRVLANRRRHNITAPMRVEPTSPVLDRADFGASTDRTAHLLQSALDTGIITALEHKTLTAMYLNTDLYNTAAAAQTLDANVRAVARRAQRAICKLQRHYCDTTADAA